MLCSKSKLVEWTEYLIDNVYIKVGNNVYRQTIGIPMGTNCAPQLANLFLFHYEHLYMKNLMHDNLCMAKRFSDTVRYIDDLLTLNNSNFEEEIPNIYPPELTLKRTSESDTKLSYLDISISICSSKYVTEVYDKRDAFHLNKVNFSYIKNIFKNGTKKVGQKSTDTRGVGISSMRKSIYFLTTTPSSHTHRFHPLPLATPTSCSPHPLATPIHSTHSPRLSSIL